MALSQRIARIETILIRDRHERDGRDWDKFWASHVEALSDEQLDRLELLFVKIAEAGPIPPNTYVHEHLQPLSAEERAEYIAIFMTMGIDLEADARKASR
ncbi:MAG: hypothetical protein ACOH2M_17140 [Cypionkella sp.]